MKMIMDVSQCKDNSICYQKDSNRLLLKLTLTFPKYIKFMAASIVLD
jgi:hypothetical protein